LRKEGPHGTPFLRKTNVFAKNKRKLANDGLQFCLENLCGKKKVCKK